MWRVGQCAVNSNTEQTYKRRCSSRQHLDLVRTRGKRHLPDRQVRRQSFTFASVFSLLYSATRILFYSLMYIYMYLNTCEQMYLYTFVRTRTCIYLSLSTNVYRYKDWELQKAINSLSYTYPSTKVP